MKNYATVCFATLLAILSIALRLSEGAGEYLIKYASMINLVALFSVILSITLKVHKEVSSRIEDSWGPKARRIDIKAHLKRNIIFKVYILYCAAAAIYFFKFRSEVINDVISIIALFISLCDESLSEILIHIISKHYAIQQEE